MRVRFDRPGNVGNPSVNDAEIQAPSERDSILQDEGGRVLVPKLLDRPMVRSRRGEDQCGRYISRAL